ncbi:class I SAM-dependent methyltransferase [Sphingomonas cavernae]|uniref:Methyltransferase n=1 Tax=Sphingomonas cavernae TaxID=2320861 RepID=A0A418W629_9SPHN|nr:class I SAM-dependent methyltransferase [Sphingomonas cavernae]RJF85462.1 methyltransferase [Sphingomonas cavernae]
MKLMIVPIIAALALAGPIAASAQSVPPPIQAALADPGRPATDKARDAARHPGQVLAFAGIKPGDKVADFLMGGGYWTRILAKAVGDKGHVYAYQAKQFIDYRPAYADEQKAAVAGYSNVTPSSDSLTSFTFPEPLDAIVTVQNYHDLHLAFAPKGFADTVAKRLYAALKPGGVLLVVDHVAAADPNFAVPDKLHRIDPAAARAEIEKAGFKFDAELNVLRNPADPHTTNVFDASIKGKTDQFIYRFRKPG